MKPHIMQPNGYTTCGQAQPPAIACPTCGRVPSAHALPTDTERIKGGTIISWTCNGTVYTRKAALGTRI